jgi:hypothetical protein
MSLSRIFPSYPIQVVSPRGGNVRIASRRVYVDFPYVYWNFMSEMVPRIDGSKDPWEIFKKN